MGLRTEVGPRLYLNTLAAAAANLTPLADRAIMVRRITITNVSASDTWTVSVGGREIMRFRILNTGNQRLLAIPTGAHRAQRRRIVRTFSIGAATS